MYDYVALRIDADPCNEIITDLLADSLAEIGFESFVPDDKGIVAYVRKQQYDRAEVEQTLAEFPLDASFELKEEIIEGEDWNKEWEQNYFKPINIDDKCVIRSSFHTDAPSAPIEILIDPKMAFGTGHHATTAGMVRLLLQEELKGKKVIDMGTGTGILAILCKKLGADKVTGIEIDEFALENAVENGNLNHVEVKWVHGNADNLADETESDYFLANINLNVIISDIKAYAGKVKKGGRLLLSGFYERDLDVIKKSLNENDFEVVKETIDNEWVALMAIKNAN